MAKPLSSLHEATHKQTAKAMIREEIVSMIASGIQQVENHFQIERALAAMLVLSGETARGTVQ